ncbi:amidase [Acerihabitans sp.]|uniref:amidase n=1 Tax=Acerihabitans sp. TaxID=2811394 RepID=UPI002ED8C541
MTDKTNYERLTAVAARQAIDAGGLTATRLLEACLERIDTREKDIRAWTFLDAAGARKRAAQLDAQPARGLLHGIPLGIKDIIDSSDMPTSYGSPIYARHRPQWDGAALALSRAAGGVILGKTVTTEFANRHAGPTRNPVDIRHTPGGSSSGSAAAVADFHIPLAIGTQTGGSVIRPAAYCGVCGFKPSFQIISNAGVKTNTEALDTVGMIARSVEDLGLFNAVLTGTPYVPVTPATLAGRTIAVCRTPYWDRAAGESQRALEHTREVLSAARVKVIDLEPPAFFNGLEDAHRQICAFESVRNYADELSRFRDRVSDDFINQRVAPGEQTTLEMFRAAIRLGERCRHWLDNRLAQDGIDALLTPSAQGEAPRGIAFTGNVVFNFLWTFLQVPAITLPHFTGPNKMPVGIQLVGRKYADGHLLNLAAAIANLLTQQD